MISKKHVASSKPSYLATAGEKFPSARTPTSSYILHCKVDTWLSAVSKEVKVYSNDRAGIVTDLRSEHVGRR
jgi:hypothetical protein